MTDNWSRLMIILIHEILLMWRRTYLEMQVISLFTLEYLLDQTLWVLNKIKIGDRAVSANPIVSNLRSLTHQWWLKDWYLINLPNSSLGMAIDNLLSTKVNHFSTIIWSMPIKFLNKLQHSNNKGASSRFLIWTKVRWFWILPNKVATFY